MPDPEKARLAEARDAAVGWYRWGPYLAERQWGTVREDYSANGDAWGYFPHDHARSRAYRWGEDGLLGDLRRPGPAVLRARPLERPGPDPQGAAVRADRPRGQPRRGRQGALLLPRRHADARATCECSTSTRRPRSRTRELVDENARRDAGRTRSSSCSTPASSTTTATSTSIVEYAKAGPTTSSIRITVTNRGPEPADAAPAADALVPQHLGVGRRRPAADDRAGRRPRTTPALPRSSTPSWARTWLTAQRLGDRRPVHRERDERRAPVRCHRRDDRGQGRVPRRASSAATDAVRRLRSARHEGGGPSIDLTLAAGRGAVDRSCGCARRRPRPRREPLGAAVDDVFAVALAPRRTRSTPRVTPAGTDRRRAARPAPGVRRPALDEAVLPLRRRALAGRRSGRAAAAAPHASRRSQRDWRELNNADVISMPDKWEYPWYAAWDLAFHCIPLALVDPDFAKAQLLLLTREWYMHPNGQLPAYEWAFSDVNPPVHAWATLARVQDRAKPSDGSGDRAFLERVFHKLLLNFTWWVNRKDREGRNVFQGGFLGLDNIGVFDRSAAAARRRPPRPGRRHGWMGVVLPQHDADRAGAGAATTRSTRTSPPSSSSTSSTSPRRSTTSAGRAIALWDERTGSTTTCCTCPTTARSSSRCARWSA